MRSLLFIASAIAVLIRSTRGISDICGEGETGEAAAIAECEKRDFTSSFVQYAADRCNSNSFYQCEQTPRGVVAYLRPCPVCLDFSTNTWTCSIDNGIPCPTEAPITEIYSVDNDGYCVLVGNGPSGEYLQKFKEGPTPDYTYYWRVFESDVPMSCPPGTYFKFETCKCDGCIPGKICAGSTPLVFTLDFDNDALRNGVSFVISPNALETLNGQSGKGLVFNGLNSYVEVPFFSQNEFRQFKFDGWFKRDSTGGDGEQGILYNGGRASADCAGSIYVISTDSSSLKAGIVTDQGTFEVVSNNAPADMWNHVVLVYNGQSLALYVNEDSAVSKTAEGVTLKTKCNLNFGRSYDGDTERYFKGVLDTLSWFREV